MANDAQARSMNRAALPVVCAMNEAQRLHDLAYAAAIQTGAKGVELDSVTAELFTALIAQSNRSTLEAVSRPRLQLVNTE